jgi:indole-3-glycerol phosphate synthase
VLEPILESVRRRLGDPAARTAAWREQAAARGDRRDFMGALVGPGLSVIAEVKRRSPSAGSLDEGLDPAGLARDYEAGGAAALSVLTEPDHFHGSLDDLARARRACSVPVLRKDFLLHPGQVWEAAAAGADAVLLIAAVLDDGALAASLAAAEEAWVAALVEVHDEAEARRAAAAGARLVGVNNRNLGTFRVDLGTAERLRGLLPEGAVAVAESGISTPEAAARMSAAGYDAVLVGEALVRAAEPAVFLRSLRGAPWSG